MASQSEFRQRLRNACTYVAEGTGNDSRVQSVELGPNYNTPTIYNQAVVVTVKKGTLDAIRRERKDRSLTPDGVPVNWKESPY